MVAEEDDDGVVGEPAFLELRHEATHEMIGLRGRRVVGLEQLAILGRLASRVGGLRAVGMGRKDDLRRARDVRLFLKR